jgi:hypothetical protein
MNANVLPSAARRNTHTTRAASRRRAVRRTRARRTEGEITQRAPHSCTAPAVKGSSSRGSRIPQASACSPMPPPPPPRGALISGSLQGPNFENKSLTSAERTSSGKPPTNTRDCSSSERAGRGEGASAGAGERAQHRHVSGSVPTAPRHGAGVRQTARGAPGGTVRAPTKPLRLEKDSLNWTKGESETYATRRRSRV